MAGFSSIEELVGTDVLLLPSELASLAGMHPRTMMKKVNRGEIPSARISKRRILIPTSLLTADHIEDLGAHTYGIRIQRGEQKVYFIRAESGPIKIGIALDPQKRLDGLQCAHFETLTLIACCGGGIRLETELHNRFLADRIRGEWFRPTPALTAEIERLTGCAA